MCFKFPSSLSLALHAPCWFSVKWINTKQWCILKYATTFDWVLEWYWVEPRIYNSPFCRVNEMTLKLINVLGKTTCYENSALWDLMESLPLLFLPPHLLIYFVIAWQQKCNFILSKIHHHLPVVNIMFVNTSNVNKLWYIFWKDSSGK